MTNAIKNVLLKIKSVFAAPSETKTFKRIYRKRKAIIDYVGQQIDGMAAGQSKAILLPSDADYDLSYLQNSARMAAAKAWGMKSARTYASTNYVLVTRI